jgi:phosphoketolase
VIRRLIALLVSGLVLGACGSISASTAMTNWVSQSGYVATAKAVFVDAEHAALELKNPSSTTAQLHTVCGVLLYEVQQANASLPTPDDQASNLLSNAYGDLGAGANQCYRDQRIRAHETLAKGAALLSEASARIGAASLP